MIEQKRYEMYAITYSDVGGKTHVIFHHGKGLFFNKLEYAKTYESTVFVPYVRDRIKRGILVKSRWLRPDVYEKLTQQEIKELNQILSTITVRKVSNIKYSGVV
ncbi:hypothetical protein HPMBJEAJ_00338 [Aeromonas phage avDM6]|nr:hypothetical protein HPMBJEAJ_00338 [Aeromonas phage avDM6]